MATKTKAAQNGQDAGSTTTDKANNGKAKIPLFTIQKDGNGFNRKIANLQHPLVCQRKGTIEIECLKKTNFIEPRYSVSMVKDPRSGMMYGVPLGIDEKTGDIKWQRFSVGDRKSYDLTKNADAIEWAIVSRAPWLLGSPFQRGKPMYKKYDKEEEARAIITRVTIRRKAMDIMDTMVTIDDMPDMLRNFGKNPAGYSPVMLHAELLKIAERSPEEFVSIWENVNRGVLTIFNRAKDLGIISYDITTGGYMFRKTLPMGVTEQSAIKFLLENKNILTTCDMESKEKDFVGKGIIKSAKSVVEGTGSDEEVSEEAEENSELATLRIEADLMGIEGAYQMTEEELSKAIEEVSAQ